MSEMLGEIPSPLLEARIALGRPLMLDEALMLNVGVAYADKKYDVKISLAVLNPDSPKRRRVAQQLQEYETIYQESIEG